MEDQTIVLYYLNAGSEPIRARMLLFHNAVHLYEADSNNFIAAYPYKDIENKEAVEGYWRFSLLKGGSHFLDVPMQHLSVPELMKLTGKSGSRSPWKQRLKLPAIILLFLVGITGFYFLVVSGLSGLAMNFISVSKEAELGEMIHSNMMREAKVDQMATAALTDFARKLKLSETYKLNFTVVDADEVNAYAVPGGYIVVYSGILRKMERPEELVALLGHEASHVNERHSLRNILREMTGGIMLGLVFGDLGSLSGTIASNANALRNLSYSRSLEEEADEYGMQRMLQNNIDPRGMVLLMDRLKEAEKDLSLPGFLSTHPLTEDRKKHAIQFLKQHSGAMSVPPGLARDWELLKSLVEEEKAQQNHGPETDSDNW
ncbi:M48 family metallopeptidase [Flavihumibacter rivuli]|uniref:M48 family metallopeptidase n=1 Tax=Flavihumibacter rivuli TaxID=2838156 RepID=UPI001BDF17D6|nr:M48 family metallopeptidase [Flavihumibacter rivuli]ULQ57204.1 M48 family metallopeptidase [Flavihumibacter rivuli]